MDIQFHTPVMTEDGEQLGVAQRIYRNTAPELETSIYGEHLMVFDFETGDSIFVPLQFVSADAGKASLSITKKEVHNNSFSNIPRYIAYQAFEATELAKS